MSSWNRNWCLEWCVSHWHFESEAKHEHIVQTQQIHPKHIHQPILWWLYFFHVAPHSPKAWKIFGLPSNFALHLGNAMTKLNVNMFGMSCWQIQPMKYQRPRAHETHMDRWSLFGLLLILDHHLLEVPRCGPRVQGCTGGTTWGSITLLGVGIQFQNDKMFMAWQLVPGFALPAASLACYTPWGPDRILASVAATLVHLVQNGLHWNNLFFENESFVMVNW